MYCGKERGRTTRRLSFARAVKGFGILSLADDRFDGSPVPFDGTQHVQGGCVLQRTRLESIVELAADIYVCVGTRLCIYVRGIFLRLKILFFFSIGKNLS